MKRIGTAGIWAVLSMLVSVSAFAAGLPTFPGIFCPPTDPYCQPGAVQPPPTVQVSPGTPQACQPTDQNCIKQYSDQQTQNYQSGVSNPAFVNPITGGTGCSGSSCQSAEQTWKDKTVQPIEQYQVPYSPGQRPEFSPEGCQQVYSPFSRTMETHCN